VSAITVSLRRQQNPQSQGYIQQFVVRAAPHHTTVLDLLHQIQWEQDSTVVFRRNCRNAICGSCAMKINGTSALACAVSAHQAMDAQQHISIEPLGNLPVLRDLVVDMTRFWQNLEQVQPYVTTQPKQEREFRQTPQQRMKLQAGGNCILCGACYSECNALGGNPNFIGPHALAKADRILQDNREARPAERLQRYNTSDMAWGCTRCYQCNEVCPVGVQPLDRITQVRQAILQAQHLSVHTAMIHRRSMVQLVQAGGWVAESKLALQVLSDRGRNWHKLTQVIPLAWRMLTKGKFPLPWQFKSSSATKEIRDLITRLQTPPDINTSKEKS